MTSLAIMMFASVLLSQVGGGDAHSDVSPVAFIYQVQNCALKEKDNFSIKYTLSPDNPSSRSESIGYDECSNNVISNGVINRAEICDNQIYACLDTSIGLPIVVYKNREHIGSAATMVSSLSGKFKFRLISDNGNCYNYEIYSLNKHSLYGRQVYSFCDKVGITNITAYNNKEKVILREILVGRVGFFHNW